MRAKFLFALIWKKGSPVLTLVSLKFLHGWDKRELAVVIIIGFEASCKDPKAAALLAKS